MYNGDVGNVSGGNNIQWNQQLAKKLDAADGKVDGKIDASIWNSFIDKVGSRGNKIKNFINIDNASKSFNFYDKKKDAGKVDWNNWENMYNDYVNKGKADIDNANNSGTPVHAEPPAQPPVTGPKRGENPEYDAIVRRGMEGQEDPAQVDKDKADNDKGNNSPTLLQSEPPAQPLVTGPKKGENPEYDAIVRRGMEGQEEPVQVQPSVLEDPLVTGPKRGENPEYDAMVRPGLEGQEAPVQVQPSVLEDPPVTGPKRGENPEYDAMVRRGMEGQEEPVQDESHQAEPPVDTKPTVNPKRDAAIKGSSSDNQANNVSGNAPANNAPDIPPANEAKPQEKKKLTNEEIQNSIDALKPGETFSYTRKTSSVSGTGSYSEQKSIIWKRETDGTLTNIVPEFSNDSNNRPIILRLATSYAADGKTVLSKEFAADSLPLAKELKSVAKYENGKPTNLTTDLTNLDKDLRKLRRESSSNTPVGRVLSSLVWQPVRHSSTFSTQEFKDTNGNAVVTYRDGEFFNQKGKKISFDKANKILSKLYEANQLSSLVQTLKPGSTQHYDL